MSSVEEVKGKLAQINHNLGTSRAQMGQVTHDLEQQISALRSTLGDGSSGSHDADMQAAIAALQAELGTVRHTSQVVGKTIEETERYIGRI